jgi:3-deoxy-manno-octulosonate cytidylyltransferase (CMP-KDO synthetase)
MVNTVVVIPARYGSSRLEGKVLAKKSGKFLVQHTCERALLAKGISQVLIAADDDRVMQACKSFGAACIMTSVAHQSGTDRIAEAVKDISADIIVNLQADEPEIDPANIEKVAALLANNPDADMATLIAPFEVAEQVANPNIVKCVIDTRGRALYFSRSPIPYNRSTGGIGSAKDYWRHLGIYAYRRDFLMKFTQLPPGFLETMEKLEQLRALENGFTILTAKVERAWDGVDTPEQYEAFVNRDATEKKK